MINARVSRSKPATILRKLNHFLQTVKHFNVKQWLKYCNLNQYKWNRSAVHSMFITFFINWNNVGFFPFTFIEFLMQNSYFLVQWVSTNQIGWPLILEKLEHTWIKNWYLIIMENFHFKLLSSIILEKSIRYMWIYLTFSLAQTHLIFYTNTHKVKSI